MAITSFAPTPAMKQKQNAQLNAQRIQNAKAQGSLEAAEQQAAQAQAENAQQEYSNWNAFLRAPEPGDIKFEIPLTVQAPREEAVKLLEKEVNYEEDRISYDIGQTLEAEQKINKPHEFPAAGSLSFEAASPGINESIGLMDRYNNQSEMPESGFTYQIENTAEPTPTETLDYRNTDQAETLTKPHFEPLIHDSHTDQPREFSGDLNLVRHHSDIDFPYFFGWIGSKLMPGNKVLDKTVLNTKHWVDTKTAVIDDLLIKQVFGIGQKKKELTPEEKAKQQTQNINKRSFFDGLRAGMTRVINPDRQRNMHSRIEALNKSLKRGNLSYEGDLDANGQIRKSSLVEEEMANSKKSEQQLLDEKRKKMMMAGKAKSKSGPGITMSSDKAHNFNNAAKLAG